MDDEAYSSSFEAFKRHMFRPVAEESPPPLTKKRPAPQAARRIEDEEENENEPGHGRRPGEGALSTAR
jgi:hypothetical protein